MQDACKVIFKGEPDYLSQEVLSVVNVSKVGEVYECEICGNVVEVKVAGGGELICCGEPMKLR